MADLNFIEKSTIEGFLQMKTGYVFDFTDRTFQEFVGEYTGCDILSERYKYASGSKANRLRHFLKIEPNHIVGKLLNAFCDYWLNKVQLNEWNYNDSEDLYGECRATAKKLIDNSPIEYIGIIQANSDDKDFNALANSIKKSIENNEPENILDRLHTFVVKYIRQLCNNHGLGYDKDEPLHSIFGKYVKFLVAENLIETEMSQYILKSSIKTLETFNNVRNKNSFAHDNVILNHDESLLIFNSICNTIRFIESIENIIKEAKQANDAESSELPF